MPHASIASHLVAAASRADTGGVRVSISLPMASTITSSVGLSAAMKLPRRLIESASRGPAMLKLRSSAIATDRGNSPAANVVIACGTMVFRHLEIGRRQPGDRLPLASVTVA